MSSRGLLDGCQDYADDVTVEILDRVGHLVPEQTLWVVVYRARSLFGG